MSNTIDFDQLPEFHKWVLCTAEFAKLDSMKSFNPRKLHLSVCIDGEDSGIDFFKFISQMESQLDKLVEKRAKEIIMEKYDSIMSKIINLEDTIDSIIKES